ncbi:MAG: hypothetical protein Q7T57_07020 [Dehalococcoidales bacterium]|nr:hypothetical protein [Dehalococcoidales bacterium]
MKDLPQKQASNKVSSIQEASMIISNRATVETKVPATAVAGPRAIMKDCIKFRTSSSCMNISSNHLQTSVGVKEMLATGLQTRLLEAGSFLLRCPSLSVWQLVLDVSFAVR